MNFKNKTMLQTIKCLFGLHHREVYKEEPLTDIRGNVIGKVIITRCVNCGKIKSYEIVTIKNY